MPTAVPPMISRRRTRFSLLAALLALPLLVASASAQIRITESTVASGDYVIGEGRVSYKFTIEGARTGSSQAEARVEPYWYIIYARGFDMYGNVFYQELAQGPTNVLFGAVTGEGGRPATSQTFEGSWSSGDVTLLNYFPLRPNPQRFTSHQIIFVLYGDGVTPATAPADNAAFLSPNISRAAGEIFWYVRDNTGPDLEMQEVTYNAGTYEGGDIIRMTSTWRNLIFPLGGYRQEIYKVHNYLTENAEVDWRPPPDPSNPPDAVVADKDDFLLAEYTMLGDRPVVSPVDTTPIVPDGSSIVRTVQVQNTPAPIPSYGIINTTVPFDPSTGFTYYDSSLRLYQPQPDDGWLDVGESVSVTVEVKVPQNYQGTYFVAGRVDPDNLIPEPVGVKYVNSGLFLEITDGQPDNNTFVSNASAKITIDPTKAPTVEAVSAIAFEDGEYIQGGGETSDASSVTADGNVIAFSSAARNLLVPPQLAEAFVNSYGRGADMNDPSIYTTVPTFGQIQPFLTSRQQIFYRLRQTRENYLASGLAGVGANADCFNPSINSANGQYIAFDSRANNLGVVNSGNRSLIYVTDVQRQSIAVVSRASGATAGGTEQLGALANGDCFNPSLSATGRFVTFESVATNLDPSHPLSAKSCKQIFLHDRDADADNVFDEPGAGNTATYLVSVDAAGNPADEKDCFSPVVNATDSSVQMYVAYVSCAPSLPGATGTEQVFRVTVKVGGATRGADPSSVLLVSENTNGEPSNQPPGAPNGSIEPSISGDGSQIAFSSSASNLVYNPASGVWDADTNKVPDVFVRNLQLSRADAEYALKGLVRVSESIPRVATGTISFTGPSTSFIDPLSSPYVPGSIVNIPQNNPQQGDFIEITSNGLTRKFVFVQPDSVAAVTVSNGGSGYTSPPIVTISPTAGQGTGAQATAVLGSGANAGRVIRVDVTNAGSGYTTMPTVTFSGGGGSGATGLAVLGAATGVPVSHVDVVSGGTGYTSPPIVTFSGGGGTGAAAQAVLGTGASADQVVRIDLISGGSGYTAPPTVTLSGGGGTGAAAIAVLNQMLTGPDVPVSFPQPVGVVMGNDVFTTRDSLINAINAEPGLNLVAYATTPPTSTPNMAYTASIYLRSFILGEGGNGTITFTPVVPPVSPATPVVVTTDLTGGGVQAEDAVLAVQGVPAGSNQPSISEDGRIVAFRSIAGNLDVAAEDCGCENTDGGPPFENTYQPSPQVGELIRPILFPASNVYVRNRQVDTGLTGAFDQEGNVSTTRVSLNNFGYPTTVTPQQGSGLGAFTTAANQAPAVGGNGRVISFSSGSEIYGGLVFGRNNLEPLDYQNARDVYIYDSQAVGVAPPPTESRPEVTLLSPENGLRVQPGSTIALAASVIPKLGKTIASVQFYVNGAPVGAPLTSEPYSLTYRLANPGQYVIRVVATDSRDITGAASSTITAGTPLKGGAPLVAVTQPPSQVSNYVVGSDLVFNATAEDSGTGASFVASISSAGVVTGVQPAGSTPAEQEDNRGSGYSAKTLVFFEGGGGSGASATVSVDKNGSIMSVDLISGGSGYISAPYVSFSEISNLTFFLGGQPLVAKRGFDGNWYAPFRPTRTGSFSLFASALDVDGNTGLSEIGTVVFWGIGDTFPAVEILPNNPGLPAVAGGVYPLRARITFAPPAFTYDVSNSSVLFYADGVFLGLGILQPDGTYLLNWNVPNTPRSYAKIYAYLSAPNFFFLPQDGNQDGGAATLYASVVVRSKNFLTVSTIEGAKPAVAFRQPLDGSTVRVGSPVLLEVTASVPAGQGVIQRVEFYQNGELIGEDADGRAPYAINFVPPSEGNYTLIALAYSTAGVIGRADGITLNAVLGTPPTVEFLNPRDGSSIPPSFPITLAIRAEGGSGSITTIEYTVNGQGIPPSAVNPLEAVYTPQFPGLYDFRARVVNSVGYQTIASALVTVEDPQPGTEGNFVMDMYDQILGQVPEPDEYFAAVEELENGLITRAEFVYALLQSNAYLSTRNRLFDFYYTLGLEPKASQFNEALSTSYISLLLANTAPMTGYDGATSGGMWTGVPYGATLGEVDVAQRMVNLLSVRGLASNAFVNSYMYPRLGGASLGTWSEIVAGMNTYNATTQSQGSAVAFMTAFYQNFDGSKNATQKALQQQYQFQLYATSVQWLLGGPWSPTTLPGAPPSVKARTDALKVTNEQQLLAFIEPLVVDSQVVLVAPGSARAGAATLNGTTGAVTSIGVAAAGAGYTSAPAVTIGSAPSGGQTATATAVLSGGGVGSFVVAAGGEGYTTPPQVLVAPPAWLDRYEGTRIEVSSQALLAPYAAISKVEYLLDQQVVATKSSTAELVSIDVPKPGRYELRVRLKDASGEVLAVSGPPVILQSYAASQPGITLVTPASARIGTPVVNASGAVASLPLAASGSGYLSAPAVRIAPPPHPGINATALAALTLDGSVSVVNVINSGSGYNSALLPVVLVAPPDDVVAAPGSPAGFSSLAWDGSSVSISTVELLQDNAVVASAAPNQPLSYNAPIEPGAYKLMLRAKSADGVVVATSPPVNLIAATAPVAKSGKWLQRYGLLSDRGVFALVDGNDTDGDGFNDLAEYAFGTNPNRADAPMLTATAFSAGLVLEWTRLRDVASWASYAIEESPDLINWSPMVVQPTKSTAATVDDVHEKVRATVPMTGLRKFYRVTADFSK